jgi:hypothetical protein
VPVCHVWEGVYIAALAVVPPVPIPTQTIFFVSAQGVCLGPRHGCLYPWLDTGNLLSRPPPASSSKETGWDLREGSPARPLRQRFPGESSAVTASPVNGNTIRASRSPRPYDCPEDVLIGALTHAFTGGGVSPVLFGALVSFAFVWTAETPCIRVARATTRPDAWWPQETKSPPRC